MKYSRVLVNNSTISSSVSVEDTAKNIGNSYTTQVGVDTIPPKVTASISGTTVTLNVSDPAEGGSGLWKAASSMPSGINKTGVVVHKVIGKNDPNPFGVTCVTPVNQTNYYRFGESGSTLTHAPVSVNITNANTNVLAYCVEDNA